MGWRKRTADLISRLAIPENQIIMLQDIIVPKIRRFVNFAVAFGSQKGLEKTATFNAKQFKNVNFDMIWRINCKHFPHQQMIRH